MSTGLDLSIKQLGNTHYFCSESYLWSNLPHITCLFAPNMPHDQRYIKVSIQALCFAITTKNNSSQPNHKYVEK